MELRGWVMSAVDEWAGEGVTPFVLRTGYPSALSGISPKGGESTLREFSVSMWFGQLIMTGVKASPFWGGWRGRTTAPFVLRTLPPNENHFWGKPSCGSFLSRCELVNLG